MRDEEAEAVLIALGPPLVWRGIRDCLWRADGLAVGETYEITLRTEESERFFVRLLRAGKASVWCRESFASLEAARWACERHRGTGAWG